MAATLLGFALVFGFRNTLAVLAIPEAESRHVNQVDGLAILLKGFLARARYWSPVDLRCVAQLAHVPGATQAAVYRRAYSRRSLVMS